MYKLLSLPPNLVSDFYRLTGKDPGEWFCTSDPVNRKLGSGGGTAWLLAELERQRGAHAMHGKRIILHAGGQSRRLPAYAPTGKILTPIPVYRWARGQKLDQTLLSLQLPLYERLLSLTHADDDTLIASGDVLIRADKLPESLPEADVICIGMWTDPAMMTHHGVFATPRNGHGELDFMLQKPASEKLDALSATHLLMMDAGVWILSERAMKLLQTRSTSKDGSIGYYDLYSDFGGALGTHPVVEDSEINSLVTAVIPLSDGEFYHYGTSRELISSTLKVQNLINDQRLIHNTRIKPAPALFVQNARIERPFTSRNDYVWVENACLGSKWELSSGHVITGIPVNDWNITLPQGVCLDMVPVGETSFAIRPYGIDDAMRGPASDEHTMFMGMPFGQWLEQRHIKDDVISKDIDIQSCALFPIVDVKNLDDTAEALIRWMINAPDDPTAREIWINCPRLSADGLSAEANLERLISQRKEYQRENIPVMARNYSRSVFYQLDLADLAEKYVSEGLVPPETVIRDSGLMNAIHNAMLRAHIAKLKGESQEAYEQEAFELLRDGILKETTCNAVPRMDVYRDQIVWGRSPVRIDLAGGWTDTPPYSMLNGGSVVNMAIELNGQPPIQVYLKPSERKEIVLRSIDLGATEHVTSVDELRDYSKVGSPFSIPKAALCLAGFDPRFSTEKSTSLESRLESFGGGLEVTLLSAIPSGSGLGTSSVLAATVLGTLNDFCNLGWDDNEICRRTLALEQLLTTGGGWQDQYGGVLRGVKILRTHPGIEQEPIVDWLPASIINDPEYMPCHLLYYTGITRTAKNILSEIVRGMFLNEGTRLEILAKMKEHAEATARTLQRCDFSSYGLAVGRSGLLNQMLDSGTEPDAVRSITRMIEDYCLGYKMPGAGGGGFIYMVAKDPEAATAIRRVLMENRPNDRARFVRMTISDTGFISSRS